MTTTRVLHTEVPTWTGETAKIPLIGKTPGRAPDFFSSGMESLGCKLHGQLPVLLFAGFKIFLNRRHPALKNFSSLLSCFFFVLFFFHKTFDLSQKP